jgi:hypothetical protein
MRTQLIRMTVALILSMGLMLGSVQAENDGAGPNVLQVFTIDVAAKDRTALLGRLKTLQGILKKEGQPGFRVWLGTYAGTSSGKLFLTVERKNYGDFGTNSDKVMGSAAVNKWLADVNSTGISKVVSQSLLVDVTP